MNNYKEINRQLWNQRTEIHFGSDFYDVQGFVAGQNSIKQIEGDLLGNLTGKSVLHLQCHFGQDTLSLKRLGASAVTGVDLSDVAINRANELAVSINEEADFICCDLYDLPSHLTQKFDIVFTTYGTIGWLPDIVKWAEIVAQYLKPGGTFVFAEFHPVVWMFDDDFDHVAYRYFNSKPIELMEGSYTDGSEELKAQSVSWNHGLAEVHSALIHAGLNIDVLREYDYSPHNCFSGTTEFEPGKFRIEKLGDKIPMVYAIKATKQV